MRKVAEPTEVFFDDVFGKGRRKKLRDKAYKKGLRDGERKSLESIDDLSNDENEPETYH